MTKSFILPVLFIFIGVFIAMMCTYGMVSPGEEVTTREVILALLSFVSFPIVALILTINGKKTLGHTISVTSPFVGLATFILIKHF